MIEGIDKVVWVWILQTPRKFLPVSSPSVKTFHFGTARINFFFQDLLIFCLLFIIFSLHTKKICWF